MVGRERPAGFVARRRCRQSRTLSHSGTPLASERRRVFTSATVGEPVAPGLVVVGLKPPPVARLGLALPVGAGDAEPRRFGRHIARWRCAWGRGRGGAATCRILRRACSSTKCSTYPAKGAETGGVWRLPPIPLLFLFAYLIWAGSRGIQSMAAAMRLISSVRKLKRNRNEARKSSVCTVFFAQNRCCFLREPGGLGMGPIDANAQGLFGGGISAESRNGDRGVVGGGCAFGLRGAGCRAAATRRGQDGSVERRAGFGLRGYNGGSVDSTGRFSRGADGAFSGQRETTASGPNGSYRGNTQIGNGRFDRNATWRGRNGSVEVQSRWRRGEGFSRQVTCRNTAGALVPCP